MTPTPKSSERIKRLTTSAPPMPIPTPHKARVIPPRTISVMMFAGVAPKRQPDAHFAAALANQIGDESVNSNHREPKRNCRKCPEHQHDETTAGQRFVEALLHGAHVVERKIRIEFVNLLLDRAGQSNRIVAAPHDDVHGARHVLRLRKVERDARVRVQGVLLHPARPRRQQ